MVAQWHPTLAVEIGFGSTYQTTLASITWTDVTTYVLESGAISVRRRRQRQLDTLESGTMAFRLNNSDGRFNPWNTLGAYYPNIKIGMPVRLSSTHDSTTRYHYFGYVEVWDPSPDAHSIGVVDVMCSDLFTLLNPWTITASYSSELASVRVANVLNSISFPAAMRNIETALTTVQAATLADAGVLQHLQTVVDSEFGVLYQGPNGDVVFQNRHHRSTDPFDDIVATFGGSGNLPLAKMNLVYDRTNLYNDIRVTRVGGAEQPASDATSQAAHGKRQMTRTGLLMTTDAEALSQAQWILYRSKDVEVEADTIHLRGCDNSSLWTAILRLDVSQWVRVISEAIGDDFDSDLVVESISITIKQKGAEWDLDARCSPARFSAFWLLGYNLLGETTVLGY